MGWREVVENSGRCFAVPGWSGCGDLHFRLSVCHPRPPLPRTDCHL